MFSGQLVNFIMPKRKLSVRERREATAPVASANSTVIKVKLKGKPRGKSFEKGHGYGAEHRFKPGVSGNPSGRSRAQQIAASKISECAITRLGEVGTKRLLKLAANKSYCQKLADEWIAAGLAGNVGAIAALADRVEGRPGVASPVDGEQSPLAMLILSMNARSDEIGPSEGRQRQLTGGEENGSNEETTTS